MHVSMKRSSASYHVSRTIQRQIPIPRLRNSLWDRMSSIDLLPSKNSSHTSWKLSFSSGVEDLRDINFPLLTRPVSLSLHLGRYFTPGGRTLAISRASTAG